MESDLEASKAGNRFSQEDVNKIREAYRLMMEDIRREREEAMNRNDGDSKREDYNSEERNMIDKMLRRRRERLMRHFRRRKKNSKSKNSSADESFTSDSDEEMKIAQEEVKRLMEKAIRANMTARDEVINTSDGDTGKKEDSKADENMFPRRRGRLIRYLRRQSSKQNDSPFQIEFHHLQLPSDDSDDSSDEGINKEANHVIYTV